MLQFYRMMHAPHREAFRHIRVPSCSSFDTAFIKNIDYGDALIWPAP